MRPQNILNPKKKQEGRGKEQKTNGIIGKQQGGRFKPNHINKHIKYICSKHAQLNNRL